MPSPLLLTAWSFRLMVSNFACRTQKNRRFVCLAGWSYSPELPETGWTVAADARTLSGMPNRGFESSNAMVIGPGTSRLSDSACIICSRHLRTAGIVPADATISAADVVFGWFAAVAADRIYAGGPCFNECDQLDESLQSRTGSFRPGDREWYPLQCRKICGVNAHAGRTALVFDVC